MNCFVNSRTPNLFALHSSSNQLCDAVRNNESKVERPCACPTNNDRFEMFRSLLRGCRFYALCELGAGPSLFFITQGREVELATI